MTACGFPCLTDITDNLALNNVPANADNVGAVMSIKRLSAIEMIYREKIAIAAVPPACFAYQYVAGSRSHNGRAARNGQVNAVITMKALRFPASCNWPDM